MNPLSPESAIHPSHHPPASETHSVSDNCCDHLQSSSLTQPQGKAGVKGPWREFLTAFITIFLAELGDKTQLATLLITAESQSPWVVFVGAATALITTSLLGVLLGRWLATRLAPGVLQTATGASLLLIAVLLLWDVVHL